MDLEATAGGAGVGLSHPPAFGTEERVPERGRGGDICGVDVESYNGQCGVRVGMSDIAQWHATVRGKACCLAGCASIVQRMHSMNEIPLLLIMPVFLGEV